MGEIWQAFLRPWKGMAAPTLLCMAGAFLVGSQEPNHFLGSWGEDAWIVASLASAWLAVACLQRWTPTGKPRNIKEAAK